jgi:hypothetical protein
MSPAIFALGIPILIWIGSYLYLASYYKLWNIFQVKIHESGRYALADTSFNLNILFENYFPTPFSDSVYIEPTRLPIAITL